ncbi:MAG: DJ-1/PfpI family protein [Actinomycetota bacterium]
MRIAFFLYEGLTTLDIIGPHDVLSRLPDAEAISVGKTTGPFMADTGVLGVTATHTIDQVDAADILVVPGGVAGTFAAAGDEEILEWIRTIDAGSTWTTSVCTGSLILGAAGVLGGKRATTHWAAVEMLAGYGVTPVADERVVFDGKVVTAAGVSSGIDMGLSLAAEIAGEDVAKTIQLGIEYDPQPPFDAGSVDKAGQEIAALAAGIF